MSNDVQHDTKEFWNEAQYKETQAQNKEIVATTLTLPLTLFKYS